jgi:hypothetical protein
MFSACGTWGGFFKLILKTLLIIIALFLIDSFLKGREEGAGIIGIFTFFSLPIIGFCLIAKLPN